MLNSIRKWLIVMLGGRQQPSAGDKVSGLAEDVPFRESRASMVSDDALFERSSTHWHFGDWVSLASLQREAFQNHPKRAKLALLAAAGRLQTGADAEAREYIALAKEWGCSKTLISRVLVSGVHNSLGRAASLMGDQARALEHYGASVQSATPGNDARLLSQARFNEQNAQLGVVATNQLSTSLVAPLIK